MTSKNLSILSIIINEIVELIFKERNAGIENKIVNQHILDYFNNQDINSQEFFNWLLNNQKHHKNSSNSIFLFGYFNYFGIETSKDKEKAFILFTNILNQDHILS